MRNGAVRHGRHVVSHTPGVCIPAVIESADRFLPYTAHCVLADPSDGVFGRFDLAALGGCHTLNVCYVMLLCMHLP